MCELMDDRCCLTCNLSMNEEDFIIEEDRLYCSMRKEYVAEDDYCNKYE